MTWARVRTQELQRARDKVQETRDSRARSVSDIKSYIAEYNRALAEAERKIENTDKEKNNELKSQIDALQKELSMWNGWKNATDDELWKFRRTKTIREGRFEERKARVDELNASITAACVQRDAIPYEAIREEMQRHEADEANYRAARHLRWELKLVVPVFGALLLCALAALVLGILRRTKAAVFTGWITAGAWAVGIVALASLVNSVGAGYDEYGYGWYGGYEPVPSPLAMLALPIAALLLGALALWWDRKRTVFRVVHTTGEFFFAPSLYSPEELKAFEAQVKGTQEAGSDQAAEAGTADGGEAGFLLSGSVCSAVLTGETITMNGNYYRYDVHKRHKASGRVTVDLLNVMRVGFTKTYSRLMLLVPSAFGMLALLIKAFPAIDLKKTFFEIEDVWDASVGVTLWSLPYQDELWKVCAVLCVLTIPLYWLSCRNDLEVNTTGGRYLLPAKGMDKGRIAFFQQAFTRLKGERQKAKKNGE